MQAMLTINKATYDMSGVSFVGDRFTYDGTSKYIYISGNLPDGVSVTYANNGKINANTYTVTAKFAGDTENHNLIPDLTATLIIDKANYDMSGIVFNGNTFKYDGTIHSISISGNLPDGVSVSYKNNDQIEKGEYVVAAQFVGDENYNKPDDICATLIITREEHTLTFKQDGQKDKICKVLDLADFTDIPSVTYVKGYKVVWEEKNYKKITSDMEINAIITLESYTITYHLFDGENALKNPSVYTVLDDIELKSAEKTGYTFKGWYTDGSFNDKIENLSDIAGNLDLYARFVPNTYTATFEHDVILTLVAKGKSVDYRIKSGKSINLYSYVIMSNFLDSEYNSEEKDPGFLGWYYDKYFTRKVEADCVDIGTNMVVYGKFCETNDNAFSFYKKGTYVSETYTTPTLYSGKISVEAAAYSTSFYGMGICIYRI